MKTTIELRVIQVDDKYSYFYAFTIKNENLPDGGCYITFPVNENDDPENVMLKIRTAINQLEKHVIDMVKK